MTYPMLTEVPVMEARLKQAGVSRQTFFKAAKINQATWHRWRNGAFEPRMRTWSRACEAYKKLVGDTAKGAEAGENAGHEASS